jgi:dolichol-phosphate mannosyltransferase
MDDRLSLDSLPPMPRRVAVVLPLYNEGGAAADLVRRMPGCVDLAIVVDDGSTDGGDDLAEQAGARVIRFGANRGIGAAIRAGLDAARAEGCGIAVVMAASGKDRPEEIPSLLAKIDEGYDYVQGSRFMKGGVSVNLPFVRGILIHSFTLTFRLLTGFKGTDVTNGFRAYRLTLLDDPRLRIHQDWLDRYELEYYIHWKAITLGFRVIEVPVSKTYPARRSGYSKIRPIVDWWHMVRPALMLALHLRS